MLKFTEIQKSYTINGVSQKILDGLSLDVKKGEVAGVFGPSGSGKSTLLHLAGLIDRPDRGSIEINGTNVSEISGSEALKFRNQKIGFVFQHHFLISELCVWQNVCFGGAIKNNCFSMDLKQNALELLDFLGIMSLAERWPEKLSGGESQRVAIARAVFNSPDLLIMDEPTGSLDSANKKDVTKLVLKLAAELKTTVLIASHDNYIMENCSKIYRLANGKIN